MVSLNKKAQMLNQEAVLVIFSVILIAIVIFLSFNYSSSAKEQVYRSVPELTYQFPAAFTHTFLMTKLQKDDVVKLNLNKTQNHFVKDLYIIDTDESRELAENYRRNYIEDNKKRIDGKSIYEYYMFFSGFKIDENKLLYVKYSDTPMSLEKEIKNHNYFFYFRTSNNKFVHIFFRDNTVQLNYDNRDWIFDYHY